MANPLHLDVDCASGQPDLQPLSDQEWSDHQSSQAAITSALEAEAARLAAIEANRVAATYILANFTVNPAPSTGEIATALNALISLLQITHVLATLPVVRVQQATIARGARRVTRSRPRSFLVSSAVSLPTLRPALSRGIGRKSPPRRLPPRRS